MGDDVEAREFQLLVFGATGFTARYAVEYLLTAAPVARWAVSARSADKLNRMLNELYTKHRTADDKKPSVLIADANDGHGMLTALMARAQVVVNFAGPYVRFGAPVVAACVSAKTHMVDITGEPVYILRTFIEHRLEAEANGTLIVPACGLDHIAADVLCVNSVCDRLRADAAERGVPNPEMVIDGFLRMKIGEHGYRLNTGTFDSALGFTKSFSTMLKLERQLPPARPDFKGPMQQKKGIALYAEQRLKDSPVVARIDSEGDYVARRLRMIDADLPGTEGLAGSDRIAFRYYLVVERWRNVIKAACSMVICTVLSFIPGVQRLLVRFAPLFTWGVFDPRGPTDEQVLTTRAELSVFGTWRSEDGSESGHTVQRLTMQEPAYLATSKMAIASALTILCERNALPRGGVSTCGIVFAKSTIIQRLQEMGAIKIEDE